MEICVCVTIFFWFHPDFWVYTTVMGPAVNWVVNTPSLQPYNLDGVKSSQQ